MQIQNVRFIIAAITTFSAYAVYVSRVNLSIAIIAMVDDHHNNNHANNGDPTLGQLGATFNSTQSDSRLLPPVATRDTENNAQSFDGGGSGTLNASSAGHHQEPMRGNYYGLPPTSSPAKKKVAPLISQEKFHWDQTEQGHILGAFFYGYILFQIPGARMAESVGAKWIIMAASAGSAVISLAFPLSTQLNSIHLLMVLRFVMGLCQSAFFPAAYVLFCRWLPEHERSILLPIMFIGSNMGTISTYIMASYLISADYGWPSVFYLSGLVCLVCSLLWCVFGSNGPDDNWLIGDQERQFIEREANNQSSESNSLDGRSSSASSLDGPNRGDDDLIACKRRPAQDCAAAGGGGCDGRKQSQASCRRQPAPLAPEPSWSKLLRSVPVWTLILSMYGNEWSTVVLCYELPSYLNKALSFPIEQNGVINSFFQLSYAVASPIMSSMGAYLLDRHLFGMRKIHVRKLFQSLATFGQLACFVSVPICGANRGLIIMFMFSAVVLKACSNAGDIMVAGDLSPEYAGTIFAFANSVGNTAGFFVPALAGALVKEPYVREEWTPFWFFTATIMGCSGLIFLIFGETRRQDFDRLDSADGSQAASKQLVGAHRGEPPLQPDACVMPMELLMRDKQHTTGTTTGSSNNTDNNNNNNNNSKDKISATPASKQLFKTRSTPLM